MFLRSWKTIRSGYKYYKYFSTQTANISTNDAIVLSDSCVEKLKQLCDGNVFMRLCVESGGCSGFQYKFDLDDKLADDDKIFEKDGVKVVVDMTSLEYIKGATIDYHTELIRSAFRVVQNPNADLGCSCGASFSVKIE
ncbi:iron-sulfur cluster assembly 2 homolog, mitochondrial [Nymphalis io]|uniref:iron-sulfur cluster assembly 2 homolog, mitochondrial n=1 Tax=Inachis io TaxID=171585 RepID=UPI002166DCE6|nr:iron-sulfur cluster assembly 2 homolog, mitochondrial [Nymphalis io]XP_050348137.1 iron-sulfur cluster assembly 2 homolog, mitochondrial [Nymphalis io]XP_050348138.1 iron-sulfur cluster assembly 2 homolog, mitochondrial [Nymphalis io]XP_050348139.1 iron-sulfur cluster assembly 2 homolog, mitochondrial [Nymphalis io]